MNTPPEARPSLSRANRELGGWLRGEGRRALGHQSALWRAAAAGESGLLHAPTGSGKSLAALGSVLDIADAGGGLRLLWITPLRALAADLAQELAKPLAVLRPQWRVETRSGDTSAARKAAQRKRLPEVLITTPESASLLLSYADTLAGLGSLRGVIVDEWHELLGNKRGVQTQLVLAALRSIAPKHRVWGLSATVGNLEQALAQLLGDRPGRLLHGRRARPLQILSLRPPNPARLSWAGHLGLNMRGAVEAQLARARSTLLFTNTRAQAELWFEALRERPGLKGAIALHHGSLDASERAAAEAGLKAGRLRCVVATSSLDLGVDFQPVDQVIQVGSPRTLGRLVQRAGRAAHHPGGVSRIVCVPTHTLELAEFAAARAAWEAGDMEARHPPSGALDVLMQHVLTRCLGQPQPAAALRDEIRLAPPYAELSEASWDWLLDFLGRGGEVLRAYPEYHRLGTDAQGRLQISNATTARRHRLMVGTIAADTQVALRWQRGGRLGQVEEAFIARLRPGDGFLFGGRVLELVRSEGLTAWVRLARGKRTAVPRWSGGRLPLSQPLAQHFLAVLQEGRAAPEPAAEPAAAAETAEAGAAKAQHKAVPELTALQPLLDLQQAQSALPGPGHLLVEHIRSREGWHLCLYPCAGRAVHEGLGACLAWRATQQGPRSVTVACNDYGLDLLSTQPWPQDPAWLDALLRIEDLESTLDAALNAAELARRHFREIAQAAGLVFTGYPGRGKSSRQLQMSTGLLYDVFARYDPSNPLLAQARREVLERELDYPRLAALVATLPRRPRVVTTPARLTPFAFPLYAESQRQQLSSESLAERLARVAQGLEAQADAA